MEYRCRIFHPYGLRLTVKNNIGGSSIPPVMPYSDIEKTVPYRKVNMAGPEKRWCQAMGP